MRLDRKTRTKKEKRKKRKKKKEKRKKEKKRTKNKEQRTKWQHIQARKVRNNTLKTRSLAELTFVSGGSKRRPHDFRWHETDPPTHSPPVQVYGVEAATSHPGLHSALQLELPLVPQEGGTIAFPSVKNDLSKGHESFAQTTKGVDHCPST